MLTNGFIGNIQLAASTDGNFLLAFGRRVVDDAATELLISRFTSRTRTWSAPQTLVPGTAQIDILLQRIGSDASGNALVLWTEDGGTRTGSRRSAWTMPAPPVTRRR